MIGYRYKFGEPSIQCVCCCCREKEECPGCCGIKTRVYSWFDISGNESVAEINQSSHVLVNLFTGPKNKMSYIKQIPFVFCQYLTCISCDSAEILLHDRYKIVAPFYKCGSSYTIQNNDKNVGTITRSGIKCNCCPVYYEIENLNGENIQTVKKEDGCFGETWVGYNSEEKKVSEYSVNRPFLFGNTEVVVEFFLEDETARILSIALVPYLV